MTRKHFKALAMGLKDTRPSNTYDARYGIALAQWRIDVQVVADACKSANINFKRETFYAACGMDD